MSGYGFAPDSGFRGDGERRAIVERFRKLGVAAGRVGPAVRSRSPVAIKAEPVSDGTGSSSGTGIWGRGRKRQGGVLVAIALDMEGGVKKARAGCGSFFDCGICWSVAKDPILTCCGHLFCWGCFYKLPYVMYPTMKCAKECPVCEGEVSESSIVPIYGDADSTSDPKLPDVESGLRDPPRPKARRVERRAERRVRQMPVARGLSQIPIPVTEALNRIRTSISVMGQAVAADFASTGPAPAVLSGDLPIPRSTRFSRVISDSAASLTFISSALNNAQRLVEDLETYRRLQRSVAEFVAEDYGDIASGSATPDVLSQQQGSSGDPSDE